MSQTGLTLYTRDNIRKVRQFVSLPEALQRDVLAASAVLPFRVNNHVLEHLIDWNAAPDDPYFQLTFPQLAMLPPESVPSLASLWNRDDDDPAVGACATSIRAKLNPHPSEQWTLNVPLSPSLMSHGIQHKYPTTVLFFPAAGQTCHAYCSYCFRWAQFTNNQDQRFAEHDSHVLPDYLRDKPQVTDVLFTGGDPLVMNASLLRRYLSPLLTSEFEHVQVIRIGTKSLGYWPHRFLSDPDAAELLHLFEEVTAAGRHLAIMSHFTHPRELQQEATRHAVRAVQRTGAVIRSQEPIVGRVNDSSGTWAELWSLEIGLGIVPYYAFALRDTGPKRYFDVPLARCVEIVQGAFRHLSGLAQTVRGPVMSASAGKIVVESVSSIAAQRVFGLRFIQARNPEWIGRLFFAEYDDHASWLSDLRPAFGEREFFFEPELQQIRQRPGLRLQLPVSADALQ
jgi:L-lysine 2,3-aminomutase